MGDIIEFKKVETKDTEESDELLDEVNKAKTLIALILGEANISIINGSLAMQSLVNKIIEDELSFKPNEFNKSMNYTLRSPLNGTYSTIEEFSASLLSTPYLKQELSFVVAKSSKLSAHTDVQPNLTQELSSNVARGL